jgi:hypothetical protein
MGHGTESPWYRATYPSRDCRNEGNARQRSEHGCSYSEDLSLDRPRVAVFRLETKGVPTTFSMTVRVLSDKETTPFIPYPTLAGTIGTIHYIERHTLDSV